MRLTYLYNSGFAIEGSNAVVVVDYYQDPAGVVEKLLTLSGKKIYVLASHAHPDHFNPRILSWRERLPGITYLFSEDIRQKIADVHDIVFLNRLDFWQDDILQIKALGSTDIGISFLIEWEGKRIFHAGDLNNWHWSEESTPDEIAHAEKAFLYELSELRNCASSLDLAMFPVDPRLGRNYMRGAEQFVSAIKTRYFTPMHFGEKYQKAEAFRTYAESKGVQFIAWHREGEEALLDFA